MMIGAFFPLHTFYTEKKRPHSAKPYQYLDNYVQYNFKNYQYILALLFAIEEINGNPYILPNISLGFDFYNTKYTERDTLVFTFLWLTAHVERKVLPNYNCKKRNFTAALTGTSWITSAQIGTLLQLFKFPQITFGPYDTILSEHGQYSSLYQIASKDTSLTLAIVSLMVHFRWSWVGLILPDNHKGNKILSDFREEMERNRICIAFVKMIPATWTAYFTSFWENMEETNVIIIYGDIDSLEGLMRNIGQRILTWIVWVMNIEHTITYDNDYFMLDSFHGSLIFRHNYRENFEFTKFIQTVNPNKYPEDIYLPKLWNFFFKCSFSDTNCHVLDKCQTNASLDLLPRHIFDVVMSEESTNIYNGVYALAHSLHQMRLQLLQMQPFENGEGMVFFPWQLNAFLKDIEMRDKRSLEWRQTKDSGYDILNLWNLPKGLGLKVKIGSFSANAPQGQQLSLSEQMIQWPEIFSEIPQSVCSKSCRPGFRTVTQQGKAICCYKCTPCAENEISNETDVDQCVKCPESHYANTEKDHCFPKSVSFLAYEDPLGMALGSIALCLSAFTAFVIGIFVKHRDTPIVKANNRALSYILLITLTFCFLCSLNFIGKPNTVACILQQTTFAIAFTVALATVLAKAITVVLAFKVSFPGRMVRWLVISWGPRYIIPICTLIQLLICGIWMTTSPPFIDQDAHTEHGHIILLCNKGSAVAFHSVLGYLCILALGSYTMAFFSRNLPDTFNESKFLSFSMLVFFCVWVTFLPVYHSTKGKVMVAMEVFSILASSTALLAFIFGPKCYIILLRPEKNSFNHIKKKTRSKQKILLKYS
ncbi:vomeronasal receptor Vmn2r94 isoform X1 [Mus musculus]|uniref:Vomeronasal 2, receptor 94 n=1 Tax=Mus musculus TaxID=10090 RepID=E9PZK8_MOUSE|nr:vomeronasal receptor Vmn2r94 [Mus musculus]XP_030105847.1 vomeronasal receptor Vmn2r94 isoform X1 [Mus musculus]|eukprot:NP_001098013.1 vomeronasal receptor Vmn2r94 [Mus musculus]